MRPETVARPESPVVTRKNTVFAGSENVEKAFATKESAHNERVNTLPVTWAQKSDLIGKAAGIKSTHTQADTDAIKHIVDGNIMGLHDEFNSVEQQRYTEEITAQEAPTRLETDLDPASAARAMVEEALKLSDDNFTIA